MALEHIKATPSGFTHWSSGPGVLTFDPECPRCWSDRCDELYKRVDETEKMLANVMSELNRWHNS